MNTTIKEHDFKYLFKDQCGCDDKPHWMDCAISQLVTPSGDQDGRVSQYEGEPDIGVWHSWEPVAQTKESRPQQLNSCQHHETFVPVSLPSGGDRCGNEQNKEAKARRSP
ncbi:hypothetical protein GCM10023306_04860 [Novosphingobium ginsenosidimutans]